jgi:hypothetical protein
MSKVILGLLFFAITQIVTAQQQSSFPLGPNPEMTPGALCTTPDGYRYPEHIPYCNRNVTTDEKNQIINAYDTQLGFSINTMDRQDFKIDHFIPLCAGGANEAANLWPQHKSVYAITDPIEPAICGKMEAGRLKQADAVELVKRAKLNLSEAPAILEQINAL